MRVLAGVLLLVMCLINGVAGLGYLLGGALFNIGGQVAKEAAKEKTAEEKAAVEGAAKKKSAAAGESSEDEEKAAATEEDPEAKAKAKAEEEKSKKALDEAGTKAKQAGAGLTAFGVFLGIVAIGQIVVAVMFFSKSRSAKIPGLLIGAAGIGAEVVSIILTSFGVTNALGILVGVLAIVAALMKLEAPVVQGAPAYPQGYAPPGGGYPQQPPQGGPYGQGPQGPQGPPYGG